jgi:Uma2 family endonuclease
MATAPPSALGLVEMPPEPVRRLTVAEYHGMIRAGILAEDAPYELLEGWLFPKMTRNPPHDAAVALLEEEVRARLPAGYHRRIQLGVTTPDSEPEPDIAVIRGEKRAFTRRHPGPADICVAIEVADSSLERDRTTKARLYARARIPVYWIVNVPESRVEVYTEPTGARGTPRYRRREDYQTDQSVPLTLDGREVGQIPVQAFLP